MVDNPTPAVEVTQADEARRLIEKLAAADIDVSGTAAIGITSADIIDANGWLAVGRVASTDMAGAGEGIRAVTADMRRIMPHACGDWADKIDAILRNQEIIQ